MSRPEETVSEREREIGKYSGAGEKSTDRVKKSRRRINDKRVEGPI